MQELLQRPTNDYEAAICAHNHKELLKAAALYLHTHPIAPSTQDMQALNPAYGPSKETKTARRAAASTPAKLQQAPPVKGKKRGRAPRSPSTDSPEKPIRKKRKTAAAPKKGKSKA